MTAFELYLWRFYMRRDRWAAIGTSDPRDVVLLCEKPELAAVALRWDHRSGRFGAIPQPGKSAA